MSILRIMYWPLQIKMIRLQCSIFALVLYLLTVLWVFWSQNEVNLWDFLRLCSCFFCKEFRRRWLLDCIQNKVNIIAFLNICLICIWRHGKMYKSLKEELYRKSVWQEELEFIAQHNSEAEVKVFLKNSYFKDL